MMPKRITPTTAKFDLSEIDPKQRYDIWRESISVIFEVDLKPDTSREVFSASLTTCHLGSFLLSTTSSQGQFFNRSQRLIAQDNQDHCLLQLYTRGSTSGQWGNKANSTVQAGDIFLLDLSQPIASFTTDFTNVTLVIPRYILQQHLPNVEKYHGCILPRDGAFARLLGEHLITLQQIAPTLSANEASIIAEGTVHLAGNYFRQSQLADDCPEIQAVARETVRHYIAKHLTDLDLTPENIASHFKMSRTYLYRLFATEQGITHYIKEKRLQQAFRELESVRHPPRKIGEIAFSLGFSSESLFSRSFQQMFAMTPSDVRKNAWERLQFDYQQQTMLDRRYEEWVRKL